MTANGRAPRLQLSKPRTLETKSNIIDLLLKVKVIFIFSGWQKLVKDFVLLTEAIEFAGVLSATCIFDVP
jgi:uncharacterized membrane protein YphA (DoxX/SURF4 family)